MYVNSVDVRGWACGRVVRRSYNNSPESYLTATAACTKGKLAHGGGKAYFTPTPSPHERHIYSRIGAGAVPPTMAVLRVRVGVFSVVAAPQVVGELVRM